MMHNIKIPTVIPDWFKYSANDAKFRTDDVVRLFGYSNNTSVLNAVSKGNFPKPDTQGLKGVTFAHNYWSKRLLIKEIKRRQEKAHG